MKKRWYSRRVATEVNVVQMLPQWRSIEGCSRWIGLLLLSNKGAVGANIDVFKRTKKKRNKLRPCFNRKGVAKYVTIDFGLVQLPGVQGVNVHISFIVIETLGLFSWNFVKKNNQKCHVTLACFFEHFAIQPTRKVFKNHPGNMVDGRNLAPVNIVDIPWFTRFFYIPGAGFLNHQHYGLVFPLFFPCFFPKLHHQPTTGDSAAFRCENPCP